MCNDFVHAATKYTISASDFPPVLALLVVLLSAHAFTFGDRQHKLYRCLLHSYRDMFLPSRWLFVFFGSGLPFRLLLLLLILILLPITKYRKELLSRHKHYTLSCRDRIRYELGPSAQSTSFTLPFTTFTSNQHSRAGKPQATLSANVGLLVGVLLQELVHGGQIADHYLCFPKFTATNCFSQLRWQNQFG